MTEENKKRINKLMIPFTKRTLSFLTAATILATGTVGCREKEENDTSSIISSISDEEITSSDKELAIDDNSSSINNESSEIEQSNNNEVSNHVTSSNKNNSTNNSGNNKNNQSNNTNNDRNNQNSNSNNNNNQSNSDNISKPSSSTPSTPSTTPNTPTMPSTLTAENINNTEVFKKFADELNKESFPGTAYYKYTYQYNGSTYTTNGEKEMQFILALLNYEYIDNSTLKVLFCNEPLEKIKQYASFVDVLIDMTSSGKVVYNFDKYLIDKNLGRYLLTCEKEYVNSCNGYGDVFKNIASNYFVNNSGSYYYKNSNNLVDYYMHLLSSYSLGNSYDPQLSLKLTRIGTEVVDSYDNMIINIYNNINSKTKIYD